MSQLLFSFDSPDETAILPREADAFGHILSPEQARVRDAGAGHLVVVAGAGTGKTELLTQRVLKLLLEGDGQNGPAELEEVVALTFTNKAAAEMRTRVYRALVRRLRNTKNPVERARLKTLRARFGEDNRIWTFDSLGARLLGLFPEHSPLPRGARLPTAGEERALVRGLGRAFWARAGTFDEAGAEDLFAFLDAFERREHALLLIRETARRPELELETLSQLPQFGDFAAVLLGALDARLKRMWRAHETQVDSIEDLAPSVRARLLDSGAARMPVKSGGFLTGAGWSAPFGRELPPMMGEAARAQMVRRLLEWRALGEDADARREALGWCDEHGEGDPLWEREWRSRRAVASLADYALWWRGAERAWKQERALADFGDVTRAALQILEQPEVMQTMRGQIAWLLVDEFQDTNRDQWQIVQGLRRHATGSGVDGNTLVVGDPKQAIYDFRGGDLSVFEQGRRELELEGAQKEQLSISRRSAPALVEWTNRAFAGIFPPENGAREPFEAPHGPLVASPQAWQSERAPGDKPGVYVLQPPSWRDADWVPPMKSSIESLRNEAAGALAKWLLELVSDAAILTETARTEMAPKSDALQEKGHLSFRGEPKRPEESIWASPFVTNGPLSLDSSGRLGSPRNDNVLETHGDTDQVVLKQPAFASISRHIARGEPALAVLFSDNTVKSLFEEVLRARGVPFESLKGRGFFGSDAVRWSVLLWRALLDSDDQTAWTGLLRSPLGGQSDVSLLERFVARRGEEDWTPSDELDAAGWRAARVRFERWRKLAGVAPVSLVMERVLEESEVAFYEANLHDAPVRHENWRKVLDLVRAREAEGEGGLRALVDFFEAGAADDREPLAPLPSGASIQLMTVHASKGLGFPACVLAQLESAKRDGGDKTMLWGEMNGAPLAAFSFGREREDEAVGGDKPRAPLAYELLKRVAFERSLAEWRRLFYVACTRAASHLILLETSAKPDAGSWGDLVRPALGGTHNLLPSGLETTASPEPVEEQTPFIEPPPNSFEPAASHEIRFDAVFGAPSSSLSDSKVRAWIEDHLRAQNKDTASARQDVPFGARGALFEQREEWIAGAWEWLAPLNEQFLLVVTGEDESGAILRARAMLRIAAEAGVEIRDGFALWDEEGNLRSVSLPVG